MSRDGSGGYSLPANNFSVAASGNTATDTDANAVWADIVAAIAQSVSKDGQTTMTGALKMGAQKITGLAVGTANTDGLTLGQAQNGAFRWGGVAGGTADALTLSLSPAITAYVDGMTVLFVSGASPNGGAATANVNTVGADAILKNGAALQPNDIQPSKVYAITSYNSDWHLWSPSPQSFYSADAGATEGPTLDLYRDSASPAANDVAGALNFYGEDSAGNKELYGKISLVIDDPTSTSEDATIKVETKIAGALVEVARLGSTGRPAEELLSVQTASASASITFVLTSYLSTYRAFKVVFHGVNPATDATNFYFRTSTNGGSSYDAGVSDYSWTYYGRTDAAADFSASDAADSEIELANSVGNGAAEDIDGELTIFNPVGTTFHKKAMFSTGYIAASGVLSFVNGVGRRLATADVDAIQFIMSSGNIAAGAFALYGVK